MPYVNDKGRYWLLLPLLLPLLSALSQKQKQIRVFELARMAVSGTMYNCNMLQVRLVGWLSVCLSVCLSISLSVSPHVCPLHSRVLLTSIVCPFECLWLVIIALRSTVHVCPCRGPTCVAPGASLHINQTCCN